jgi:hypothetical protein
MALEVQCYFVVPIHEPFKQDVGLGWTQHSP